jgi:hypothetical protein
MFTTFGEFITCVKEARFTFGVIWEAIVSLFNEAVSNPDVSAVWNGFLGAIESINSIVFIICTALALIVAFFGRKIYGAIKFVLFFALGFLLGTHLLTPLLPADISLPGWIVGIVLALILGVLSKFIYIVFYIIAGGYSAYVLAYYGFFLVNDPVYTNSRAIGSLVAAIVAVVLLLVFKQYAEMLITSALGGWLAALAFRAIYDFTAFPFLSGFEWLAILVLSAVIGLLGFSVQYKTRTRY